MAVPLAKPADKDNFMLPRSLSLVDPSGIEQILTATEAPENVGPRVGLWNTIVQRGDKREMAGFLSALMRDNPRFPFQQGQVTGLPSEFDIGDGRTRLFDPMDIQKWTDTIEKSNLSEDEKAQRVALINQDGIVVRMTERLAPRQGPGPAAVSMPKRVKNSFGMRKIQE